MAQQLTPRIISIDILKVMAVLCVLNSHMEICYGNYSFLATGGAIGDALFFFCSGFMLFRGKSLRFDNFIKRRISRIYPTVFIVAIVGTLLFGKSDNIVSIILYGGGWFVSCIMIYYALIWLVKAVFFKYLNLIWIATLAIVILWFYLWFDHNGEISMYGNNYFKWGFFFIFMLQGAIMGLEPYKYKFDNFVILKLLCCILAWYSIFILNKYIPFIASIQWISLIPLYGITYYTYVLCCAPFWTKVYNHKIIGQLIYIIGGLCLECYLIQYFIFTDKLNCIFPFNIPLIMLYVLFISYIINFLSTAFSQTFSKEGYNWSKCLLSKN